MNRRGVSVFCGLPAEADRRKDYVHRDEQGKGHSDDRHPVFPRGHIDDLEVGQDIGRFSRAQLRAGHHQDNVDDERADFKVQEVERQQVHHQTVADDVNRNRELGREAWHARTEDTHDHDSKHRRAGTAGTAR